MGYSISIFVIISLFLLMGYFYVEITGKIKIPEQRVYKELEEIIKNRYNDAWQIKELVRDVGGPNYDPKIFRVVLQDREINDLSFSFYWNAVKKEVHFYYDYGDSVKVNAIQSAYQKALSIYEMEKGIRSRIDKRVKKFEFSHFHFSVFVDFEPEIEFINSITHQMLMELARYSRIYTSDMSLKFISPLETEGLYNVQLRNNTSQIKSNFQVFKNGAVTLNTNSVAVQRITTKMIQQFKDTLLDSMNMKIAPRLPFGWLHQSDLNQVYLLYFLQEPSTLLTDNISCSGHLLIKTQLDNSDLKSYKIIQKNRDNLKSFLKNLEADLPESYWVRE